LLTPLTPHSANSLVIGGVVVVVEELERSGGVGENVGAIGVRVVGNKYIHKLYLASSAGLAVLISLQQLLASLHNSPPNLQECSSTMHICKEVTVAVLISIILAEVLCSVVSDAVDENVGSVEVAVVVWFTVI